MTRQQLVALAIRNADDRTVGRIEIVLGQFKTCEDFLKAEPGTLMKAYNDARPNGKHGLGKKFFCAMDALKSEVAVLRIKEQAEKRQAEKNPPEQDKPKAADQPLSLRFGTKELAALGVFLEAVGIHEVDLVRIREFLDAVTA